MTGTQPGPGLFSMNFFILVLGLVKKYQNK